MEKFIIVKDGVKKVRRFNLTGRALEFKLKPVPENEEPITWIKEGLNQVFEKAVEGMHPTDQIGFTFSSKDIQKGVGWMRFRPVEEVTFDDVWTLISGIYQSNSLGLNTETFCLNITTVKIP